MVTTKMKLSSSYGKNVHLSLKYDAARTERAYNHGIVCSEKTLPSSKLFQFTVEYDDGKECYDGCVQFGVTAMTPEMAGRYPFASEHLKGKSFILADPTSNCACLFIGKRKVLELPGVSLRSLTSAGVMITSNNSLHFFLNHHEAQGRDKSHLLFKLPSCLTPLPPLHGVVDLYGRCSGIKLLSGGSVTESAPPVEHTISEEDIQHIHEALTQREAIETDKSFNVESSVDSSLIPDSNYSQVPVTQFSQQNLPPSDYSPITENFSTSDDFSQLPPPLKKNSFSQNPTSDDFSQLPPPKKESSFSQNPLSEDFVQKPLLNPGVHQRPLVCRSCTSGYQDLCWQFLKDTAQLKDCYFDEEFHKCYCESCKFQRNDPTLRRCGGMRYAVPPVGWVKFGLRLNNTARIKDIDLFNKGLKAYHGTMVSKLKSIVENSGRLLPPGVPVSDTEKVEIPAGHYNKSWKPDNHDPDQIFLSPSIKYTTHKEVFAKTTPYTHPTTGKQYKGQVCLKVLVEPDAYKISSQTVDNSDKQVDELFDNSELELCVKVHTTAHLYGLLVKLVPV